MIFSRLHQVVSLLGVTVLVSTLLAVSPWQNPVLAQTDEVTCTGQNIMEGLADNHLSLLQTEADKISNGTGNLWRVDVPGKAPSYIFGTMHLADPRLRTMTGKATVAFESAATLALEITEILEPEKMAAKAFTIVQLTSYLDGQSIDDKLDPVFVPKLQKRVEDVAGLPWSVARKMRPWALLGAVALPACEFARKRVGMPFLDMALGQNAKSANKTIVGLETLDSQLKAMSELPEESMLLALRQTIDLGPRLEDMFETMIVLYKREELGLLWALLRHFGPEGITDKPNDAGYADFQRIIIDKRNIGMADASEPLIAAGGAFIAVGALHLPGEKGLVQLLKDRGYTVSRP
ncbi:MAG: TraB/GumN family protein [Pseudomonadota bacterium]